MNPSALFFPASMTMVSAAVAFQSVITAGSAPGPSAAPAPAPESADRPNAAAPPRPARCARRETGAPLATAVGAVACPLPSAVFPPAVMVVLVVVAAIVRPRSTSPRAPRQCDPIRACASAPSTVGPSPPGPERTPAAPASAQSTRTHAAARIKRRSSTDSQRLARRRWPAPGPAWSRGWPPPGRGEGGPISAAGGYARPSCCWMSRRSTAAHCSRRSPPSRR